MGKPEKVDAALTQLWQDREFGSLEKWRQAEVQSEHRAAKEWAVAAGIAHDKHALQRNKPTQILAGLADHRADLPDLLTRLVGVQLRLKERGGTLGGSEVKLPLALETTPQNLPDITSDALPAQQAPPAVVASETTSETPLLLKLPLPKDGKT